MTLAPDPLWGPQPQITRAAVATESGIPSSQMLRCPPPGSWTPSTVVEPSKLKTIGTVEVSEQHRLPSKYPPYPTISGRLCLQLGGFQRPGDIAHHPGDWQWLREKQQPEPQRTRSDGKDMESYLLHRQGWVQSATLQPKTAELRETETLCYHTICWKTREKPQLLA